MKTTRGKVLWIVILLVFLLSNYREEQEPFLDVEDKPLALLDSFGQEEVGLIETDKKEELSLFASSQWTDAEGLGGGQIWLRDTAVAFLYSFQCVSEHKVLAKEKNTLTISWAKSYGCKYSTRIEEKYNELLGQKYSPVFCKIVVTSDTTLSVVYSDEFIPWVDSLNGASRSLNKGNTYPLSLKRWHSK